MGNEQKIIDRITADAKSEAKAIVDKAKIEAEANIKSAREKAEKEMALYLKLAEAEAEKAASKEISGAEMEAKKKILIQKQELITEVIKSACDKLANLSDSEYEKIILSMIEKVDNTPEAIILFSAKDRAKTSLFNSVTEKGFKISDETRDIDGGFVVKTGDIEYNYSFSSIVAVEWEQIEQTAAKILFG